MRIMTRICIAAAIAGSALAGAPATAGADPGCDHFGFLHPMCAGGAWDESASQEFGPDASTEAGLEAAQEPAMVPNIDGGLSTPGSPGAV